MAINATTHQYHLSEVKILGGFYVVDGDEREAGGIERMLKP